MAFGARSGFLRGGIAAIAIGAMTVSMIAPVLTTPVQAAEGPASVADLAERLIDSVVNVSTSQNVKTPGGDGNQVPMPKMPEGSPFQEFFDDFFGPQGKGGDGDQSRRVQSLGSGFVIDAEKGIVVTNNHVIADADEIEVNFNDGSKLKAEVLGKDLKTDLAVLKIDPTKHKLTAVKFGDSQKSRIGDWVMAIGNPFGLGGTVTVGIISARNRNINSGPYDSFIQTDAAINRGNSGGPLFNMDGEVIGVNTAIISPSGGSIGIGFAIPSEMAVGVIDQLKEFGETRRGWLGVRIQPVTDDVAESLGMSSTKGALVAGLVEGSNVDNKEIQPGDVIVKFDGKTVDSARDLPRVVAESPVGKEVEVVVVRKGKEQTVKVKLGRLEEFEKKEATGGDTEDEGADKGTEQPDKPASVDVLGMKLAALDDATREKFKIAADVQGVVVTEVAPNSAAAEKRIAPGEVIVDIGQETVVSPEDVEKRVNGLRKEGRKNALLMLASKTGELRFVTVRME
ncbi:Do family serine endopeptidase [Phyllobacterium salinisoli]|uniref:Probable periplasmic serine endoprotease DegP-like n=1 Tax=Phyllobacterium salinisoli TaxID=1899321 RepID=A0A368KAA0_9HYPH|nr:Do family serine endopeptidase [Phyllobacterium salinisoli]RCS25433.1 Do family serine endopeptidase [Phyllobacterium salinisoli]